MKTLTLYMASNYDIALFRNDVYAVDGDFVITEADIQHISDTMAAFPGWWKENPADGVGILRFLNSSGQDQAIRRAVRLNLMSDGYRADAVDVGIDPAGNLTITPNAKKL